MMQVPAYQIVDVSVVRNLLVSASLAMLVCGIVRAAVMAGSAVRWILGAYGESVLVDVIFMRVMQMAVMQVVGVTVVHDGRVAATCAVLVIVTFVDRVLAHGNGISSQRDTNLAAEAPWKRGEPQGSQGDACRASSPRAPSIVARHGHPQTAFFGGHAVPAKPANCHSLCTDPRVGRHSDRQR